MVNVYIYIYIYLHIYIYTPHAPARARRAESGALGGRERGHEQAVGLLEHVVGHAERGSIGKIKAVRDG